MRESSVRELSGTIAMCLHEVAMNADGVYEAHVLMRDTVWQRWMCIVTEQQGIIWEV